MGGSLRLMEWWGGPCKWWCGGVGAVVVASAVDRSTNTGCCHHQLELMAMRSVDG